MKYYGNIMCTKLLLERFPMTNIAEGKATFTILAVSYLFLVLVNIRKSLYWYINLLIHTGIVR